VNPGFAALEGGERLRVLVLYDEASTHTSTVLEHLQSIKTFSRHEIYYASGVRLAQQQLGLDAFDVVILHYGVRLSLESFIAPVYAESLPKFKGLKILFIQDEYDTTETARKWMERLKIDVVFTCVPPRYIETVYPRARFPSTEFINTLTGFVPPRYELGVTVPPMTERKIAIAYRGRALPHWYGKLGQEKLVIGQRMRAICRQRGIPCDIEWDDSKRIYGDAWYSFVMSARATLGTESGANVFDEHGALRRAIERDIARNPSVSFEEAFEKHLRPHEGKVMMNQVSPRVFEAVALRTGLILFEGEYSGVVQPGEHYIPLKKDFSNVDEVLATVSDGAAMEAMVERAHRDVIRSGKYSYRVSVGELDAVIARKARRVRKYDSMSILFGTRDGVRPAMPIFSLDSRVADLVTSEPLFYSEGLKGFLKPVPERKELLVALWRNSPARLRWLIRPVVPRLRPYIRRLWGQRD